MSFTGKSPTVESLKLTPVSVDPANPQEGQIQYADGTFRTEGPWVYQNGVWAQFSTGSAITVVNNITLTPQASDPGSPAAGMLFYSNGTSRTAGLWAYNGTGWVQVTGVRYQEFTQKARFKVRAASTANVVLASQVENGDSFGGVTLATSDLVLLKNQTTTTENGVYIVQASGAPVRSTSYDTGAELTGAQIYVTAGTNIGNLYFQANTITTVASDAQSWGTTPYPQSFTVPAGVYALDVLANAGGGGGGAGGIGSDGGNNGAGGGSGGAGSALQQVLKVPVTPGDSLTLTVGPGGVPSAAGVATTVTGLSGALSGLYFPGGSAGLTGHGGAITGAVAGATTYATTVMSAYGPYTGGAGGAPGVDGVGARPGGAGATLIASIGGSITGAAAGNPVSPPDNDPGAPGGGGASSNFGAGGVGANFTANGGTALAGGDAPQTHYGAAGAGGAGGGEAGNGVGGLGGHGADGYVRISWA